MITVITVAQAMVACLEAEGVSVMFGIPGATICPFYDALYDSNITHRLVRHEQSAGHAASGYARMSGKVGVCVATSGPGALNLLTAVATAYMDSIPLVVITGQVSSEQLGRDVFQEADITGSAAPFVKHSYLIKSAAEIPTAFKQAFHIANTGRRGPVLIDVPVDIQREQIEFAYPEGVYIRSYNPNVHGHMGQIKKLIAAITAAERPLICAGGGIFAAGAESVLLELIEHCRLPLVTTMMGLGAVEPAHPLNLGMVGMYGNKNANLAVNGADLLILVGARVGDRAIMSPIGLSYDTVIAHLDIDPAEIGKNIKTDIPIVGDAHGILTELASRLPEMDCSALCKRYPRESVAVTDSGFTAKSAIEMLLSSLPSDTAITADVGQNQLYAAQAYSTSRLTGRFFTSGGMGTMGYALPAAIGAALAKPGTAVVSICGDGGVQMSIMELATLAETGLPVKLVVINNGGLGLVRELQQRQYHGREIAVTYECSPHFAELAHAYGIESAGVHDADSCKTAIAQMLSTDRPFLLEVMV